MHTRAYTLSLSSSLSTSPSSSPSSPSSSPSTSCVCAVNRCRAHCVYVCADPGVTSTKQIWANGCLSKFGQPQFSKHMRATSKSSCRVSGLNLGSPARPWPRSVLFKATNDLLPHPSPLQPHTQTYAHTHTHTHTNRHVHTDTHTHTHIAHIAYTHTHTDAGAHHMSQQCFQVELHTRQRAGIRSQA